MTKRALICGVSGQDGAYLAQLLLQKGYEVTGTSRDATLSSFAGLSALGIRHAVRTVSMAGNDFRSVLTTVKSVEPDEVYNLAGQSSVGLSFEEPAETMSSIVFGTLNLLEAIRFMDLPIRFYSAGSGECYGDTDGLVVDEEMRFRPRSPYAVAKATAHELVVNYREAYGVFGCNGILFNHESPLRPKRFVTQKVVHAAARIAAGNNERVTLGNIDIERDWGWAPEYVDAMWRMVSAEKPNDYVVATGRTVSLRYFVEAVFRYFGLDAERHVETDASLLRPSDVRANRANPARAARELGWAAKTDVDGVVKSMCEAAQAAGDSERSAVALSGRMP